jgi:hypothetical protein
LTPLMVGPVAGVRHPGKQWHGKPRRFSRIDVV